MKLTTLCYIEKDGAYLMLHRVKKEHDVNKGKWIGVGGKFEAGESPDDCLLREVREETGLTLTRWRYRGIITFCYNDNEAEYMHLYTATGFTGTLADDCHEGVLRWVAKSDIPSLSLWQGDRIFLNLLAEDYPPFSLKLLYHDDELLEAVLDGKTLPLA
ncbi:MAG: 8-oxo-dGTP diphosphatase [Peptococcaceae bacterium]|nr:8-oxo-dGTP diphosphatase [Peptococcaceae bacterium]